MPGSLADTQSPKALCGSQAPGGELLANLRGFGSGQAAPEVAKVPQGAPRGGGSPSRPSPRAGSDARKHFEGWVCGGWVSVRAADLARGAPPRVGRSPTPPPKWGQAPLHRPNDWPTNRPIDRAEPKRRTERPRDRRSQDSLKTTDGTPMESHRNTTGKLKENTGQPMGTQWGTQLRPSWAPNGVPS